MPRIPVNRCANQGLPGMTKGAVWDATAKDVTDAAEDILRPLGVTKYRITVTAPVITNDVEEIAVAIDAPLNTSKSSIFTNYVAGKTILKEVVHSQRMD